MPPIVLMTKLKTESPILFIYKDNRPRSSNWVLEKENLGQENEDRKRHHATNP